jgi:DNA-binding transcriptional LysR family regulator
MGVRLLTRTTRSVAPTEAGERLLRSVQPRIEEIEAALGAMGEPGARVSGTVRIRSPDYAADTILRPRLHALLPAHPALRVEISIDDGQGDAAGPPHDIDVHWGHQVASDRVAVRIAPDCRMAIVAAPAYLALHARPVTPQDLTTHNCVTSRRPDGSLAAWRLAKGRRNLSVRVAGQAIFNGPRPMLAAALSGCGLAFVPEDLARPHLEAGRLARVLEDWSPTVPGLHLSHARQLRAARAVAMVVDALRARR